MSVLFACIVLWQFRKSEYAIIVAYPSDLFISLKAMGNIGNSGIPDEFISLGKLVCYFYYFPVVYSLRHPPGNPFIKRDYPSGKYPMERTTVHIETDFSKESQWNWSWDLFLLLLLLPYPSSSFLILIFLDMLGLRNIHIYRYCKTIDYVILRSHLLQ